MELTSRVTGLSKTMSGAGIGLGLIASSAMGRGALMAIARRVPMIAAVLALDDIMSGLNGDDSVVGSMPGGQAALNRIVQKMGEVRAAANEMASSINDALGLKGLAGEDALGTLMRSVQDFISGRVVKAFDDFATRLGYLADALNAIASAIKERQMDRSNSAAMRIAEAA